MQFHLTPIERAFELARSGECAGLPDIRERLRKEGHSLHHLTGPTLLRQLRDLCQASFPADPALQTEPQP